MGVFTFLGGNRSRNGNVQSPYTTFHFLSLVPILVDVVRPARLFCPSKSELIYVSETRGDWSISGRGDGRSSSGDVSGSEIIPGIRRRRDEEVGRVMLRSTTEIDRIYD